MRPLQENTRRPSPAPWPAGYSKRKRMAYTGVCTRILARRGAQCVGFWFPEGSCRTHINLMKFRTLWMEVRIFRDVLHFFHQSEIRGTAALRAGRKLTVLADPYLRSVLAPFVFRLPYSGNR